MNELEKAYQEIERLSVRVSDLEEELQSANDAIQELLYELHVAGLRR
jgi:cell division septum initiation protein DivIVA